MKPKKKYDDFGEIGPPLKILVSYVNIGRFLRLHPYKWSEAKQAFVCEDFKRHFVRHAIWCVVIWTYTVFLANTCYRVAHDPEASTLAKVRIVYWNAVYGLLNLGTLTNLKVFGQHHIVINQILSFARHSSTQYGIVLGLKSLKWALWGMKFTYFFGISSAIGVFRAPHSPQLLTSLLAEPQKASTAIKIGFFLTHLVLIAGVIYYAMLNGMVIMCYIGMMSPVVKRLKWRKNTGSDSELSPREIYRTSVTLKVVQAGFTAVFGSWIMLIISWGTILTALNIFQAVVFQDKRSSLMGFVICALLRALVKSAGDLYEIAAHVRGSWRAIDKPGWFQKYVRASRPARVPVGSFFYADKGLWPTLFDLIVSNAASLIITYREE